MDKPVIVDAGPLVALLDASDQHHEWAVASFKTMPAPLLTCEAAIAEAFHLLRRLHPAQRKILDWIHGGILRFPMSIEAEVGPIRASWQHYTNVPMSLADACLVRLAELNSGSSVCTTDSDFIIYRIHGNRKIPLIHPMVS